MGEWRRPSEDTELEIFPEEGVPKERFSSHQTGQSATSIQAWLVGRLANVLKVAPGHIDVQEPFARYGLDSKDAAGLSGELEEWLGRRLPQTLVYDYPTVDTLARYLAGDRDTDEAIRLASMARASGGGEWLKLEVTPDPRTLLPDPVETLKATEVLVKEGFIVLPYMNADPILSLRLQDAGAAAVMPLGSPIGTNQGILTRFQIEIIIDQARVPVVVDAGLGAPSHAAFAMEMGADAVLVNTAIAVAGDPVGP